MTATRPYQLDALEAIRTGVRANGVTDDSVALQAAFTASQAQGRALQLPHGTILATGITMATLGQQVLGAGPGRTIWRVTGNTVGLTVTKSSLTMGLTTTIRDIQFLGGSVTQGTGIKIAAGGSAGVNLHDIYFKLLLQGLEADGPQFCLFDSIRAESCDVGFYLHATAGGGSNNTWETCTAQGCNVGLVMIEDGIYPIHSNDFINLSAHDNGVCGVYMNGVEGMKFNTPAHENNGSTGPITRYTKVIKRSTWHIVSSRLDAMDCQWTTGTPDPNLIMETGSVLTFGGNYSGTQMLSQVDSTSAIFFTGRANLYGRFEEVVDWPAGTLNNPVQMLGQPICVTADNVQNVCPNPRMLNLASYAGNGSTNGTETDAVLGLVPYVDFAASIGDPSTNRGVFDTKATDYTGTNIAVCSFLLRSDIDCAIHVDAWDTSSAATHTLVGGRTYRMVILGVITGTKGKYVIIYPTTAAGAKLNLWNCHALAPFPTGGGTGELLMQAFVKNGWFNPGKPTYAATNVTVDRAFDADTVAVAELADVVGTLIADLRARGSLL